MPSGIYDRSKRVYANQFQQYELEILNKYYVSHGVDKCLELLPHRSRQSIFVKAWKLGLKYHESDDSNLKYCSACGVEKPLTEFGKCMKSPDNLNYQCKQCLIEYRAEHKKEKAIYDKIYRQARSKTDLNYRLRLYLSCRIWHALRKNKVTKSTRTLILIGCSVPELRIHLEKQFKEGMTWNNYGIKGWHIDHILPCASFDLTDETQQQECFHFSNLQPLWWYDNLSKGSKTLVVEE